MTITGVGRRSLESAHANLVTMWKAYRKVMPPAAAEALGTVTNQVRIGLDEIRNNATPRHAQRRSQS